MAHISVDMVLRAEVYNYLLIDHSATQQAALLRLKTCHVPAVAKILIIHGVSDNVLHRHFILKGEAMLHKSCVISGPDGNSDVTINIIQAVPCVNWAKPPCFHLCEWSPQPMGLLRTSTEDCKTGLHNIGTLLISLRRHGMP
jgi:hypothetical protein